MADRQRDANRFTDKMSKRRERARRKQGRAPQPTITFRPHPGQVVASQVISRGCRIGGVICGRKWGKSTWGVYEVGKQFYKYGALPPLGWLVSPNYPMSLVLERKVQQVFAPIIIRTLKVERAYILQPSEASAPYPIRLEIKSADRVNTLRGPSVPVALLDEPAECEEEVLDMLLLVGMDCPRAILYLTGTPKGYTWLHRRVFEEFRRGNPDVRVVRGKTEDNCREHSGGYVSHAEIERVASHLSERMRQQELEGEFVSFEGLVYSCFDFERDCFEDAPKLNIERRAAGIDFGFSDPFAALAGVKDVQGCWWIVEELYGPELPIEHWAKELQVWQRGRFRIRDFYADPEDRTAREVLHRYSVYTNSAKKDVFSGIQHIRNLMEKGKLKISRKCKMLLNELARYQWKEKDTNRGEQPMDAYNHACDALRYLIFSDDMLYDWPGREKVQKPVRDLSLPRAYTEDQMDHYVKTLSKMRDRAKQDDQTGYPKWYVQ